MAAVNSYANIALKGGLTFKGSTRTDVHNPKLGQTCFDGGILYIFADIGGFETWYPLNKPRTSYVHSQGVASLQWVVNHGLGTTDIVVAVYDEAGREVHATVESTYDADRPEGQKYQAIIKFTEATVGVAVIFGTEHMGSAVFAMERIEAGTILRDGAMVLAEGDQFDCGEL